ncbi:hypothetical protein BSP109_03110 [Brevibacterium sp. Mu109]|uniref:hypothetical protein n=1 Tax=Brevibacterium sp. Mu109 TaxID=1255669 RepID=UPI000C52705A|nr:hypothetical protein [Brevibacterium sp. Mu109]SMX98847.1 hypothetical protein BSP109_03110 [Brevibacterium sp. Mu109]
MSTATDLAEIARAIAEQAEKLDRARGALREHPEQVADVVDPLVGMLLSIDRVIDAAGTAFQEHGATAVTTFGDQARGSARVMFDGGLLTAASDQVLSLRNTLMGVSAESSSLVWPEHDPLAAEELLNYRRFLEQRERQLDPDAESRPTAAESPKRGGVERP